MSDHKIGEKMTKDPHERPKQCALLNNSFPNLIDPGAVKTYLVRADSRRARVLLLNELFTLKRIYAHKPNRIHQTFRTF